MGKKKASRTLRVGYLSRVEGEGALRVKIRDGVVDFAEFRIFEPPRFFEAFLRGRDVREVPDIVARICGICPIAYQLAAVNALEAAFGIKVSQSVRDLRRLLCCAEWIQSHAMHIYMFHAPDFLGFPDVITMAKEYPRVVRRGFELKKAGNKIISVLGGRSIHPVNVKMGGFHRLPGMGEIRETSGLLDTMREARSMAAETVRWVAGFHFPNFEVDYEFVALSSEDGYAMNEGQIASSGGINVAAEGYEGHFEEKQVAHSNALQSSIKGRGRYLVGPLARYNLNSSKLSVATRELAQEIAFPVSCRNPFQSIVVRALEVFYACDEAVRLIGGYSSESDARVGEESVAVTGCGCTEAPRGLLYHRYQLREDGLVREARIVPPTSQNVATIEADVAAILVRNSGASSQDLAKEAELAVRNHDPCISCATHFLEVDVAFEDREAKR